MKIGVLFIQMMKILQYMKLMNQAQVILLLLVVMMNGNACLKMNVFRYITFVLVHKVTTTIMIFIKKTALMELMK